MSIVDWFTGGTRQRAVEEEGVEQLRFENSELQQRLAQATDEARALRSHVEQARVIIEHNAHASPDSEALEQQVESLKRAHDEAIAQYDTEHRERLKVQTELIQAQISLQKVQTEAQHARNANAVLEERVDMSAKSAEEASDSALKIECAKDAEIVSNERHIGDLVARLNQMKVEQLALKRDLSSCSSTTQEAHGNIQSIHGFAQDVVNESRGKFL
jgi:chromosome segregation ATPase